MLRKVCDCLIGGNTDRQSISSKLNWKRFQSKRLTKRLKDTFWKQNSDHKLCGGISIKRKGEALSQELSSVLLAFVRKLEIFYNCSFMLFKGRGLPRAFKSQKRLDRTIRGVWNFTQNGKRFFDAVVQLDLEHEPSKLGVAGSSPVSAILTRKSCLTRKGWESRRKHSFAWIWMEGPIALSYPCNSDSEQVWRYSRNEIWGE